MATKNPQPATPPATPSAQGVAALRVRSVSPMGAFRRGGIAFSHEATTIPLADLSREQIEDIRSETRMLVVDEVLIDPTQPPEGAGT